MKRTTLMNISATSLLLVVSGAFFACLTFGTLSLEASSHAHQETQSAGDAAVAHVVHAQAFSLSTAMSAVSSDVAILFAFLSAFVSLFASVLIGLFDTSAITVLRTARKRLSESKQHQTLISYLSRFVRSPEFA